MRLSFIMKAEPAHNIALDPAMPWIARFEIGNGDLAMNEVIAWSLANLTVFAWSSSHKTLRMSDIDAVLFKLRWFDEASL